ncbi:MAG: Gfo/Idh/MocA family oxidoreductase [Candidatus Margulisiibacteriota bacterium]
MEKNKSLKVLIVGAGMYVCGRGTTGYGTILPALFQAQKDGWELEVKVAATSAGSVKALRAKLAALRKIFGFGLDVECFPKGKSRDPQAYQQPLKDGWWPDCAIVSVPDHLHFAITANLLRRSIPCLVVKPLAPTLREAKELVKLQRAKNVYGAVEFHKRYDRSNLKLKEAIGSGKIGDPLYFIVEYSQRKNIPLGVFKSWATKSNIFQYLGVHYVDIIYFATRALPQRVMAVGQKNFLRAKGVDTYDSIQCLIEWKSSNGRRFTSAILVNWIDPEGTSAMSDQKIKVIGTKGRYEADQKKRGICLVTDAAGIEEPNPDFSAFYANGEGETTFRGYGVESILQFVSDVRGIIDGETSPEKLEGKRPTFSEALVSTAVVEAANQSLKRNGAWVNL